MNRPIVFCNVPTQGAFRIVRLQPLANSVCLPSARAVARTAMRPLDRLRYCDLNTCYNSYTHQHHLQYAHVCITSELDVWSVTHAWLVG